VAPSSRQAQERLDQAQSLEENVAAMSPERFDPQTRKLMRYQSRTSSQRRKRYIGSMSEARGTSRAS